MKSERNTVDTTEGANTTGTRRCIGSVEEAKVEEHLEVTSIVGTHNTMTGLGEETRYKKGVNVELDKKFALYKKVNLFTGNAYHDALSQKEAKVLIKLWTKARRVPWNLNVQDVSTLVEFYERIMHWRRNRKKEKARLRKEKARGRLRDEAKKGNSEVIMKLESIRKADRVKSEKYWKLKQKQRKADRVKSAKY